MGLPENYIRRMETLLRRENLDFPAFMAAAAGATLAGLRANTLKTGPEALRTALGGGLAPVPWCEEGFYAEEGRQLSKSALYAAGAFYLQEPSAMCPAALLRPEPGARALDLCAAPGGKATQLAARMAGRGFLLANDPSPSRCKALLRNLNRAGVTNAAVTSETPERLAAALPGFFNDVLADAPCSGEGMFRRDPRAAGRWQGGEGNPFPPAQLEILRAAAALLAPGGRLVYSTCTFNTDENEAVVRAFLDERADFSLVPLPHAALGVDQGIALDGDERLRACGRIWPHRQAGEGHFAALFQKEGTPPPPPKPERPSRPCLSEALESFFKFAEQALISPPVGAFQTHGRSLFLLPEGAPDLSGLRVASSGFYLGDCDRGRFTPSQALAMALSPGLARNAARLSLEDERVRRYLRGESFDIADMIADAGARDGWNLVCAGGLPLGWGKAQGGRLKNKIEKWMIEQ